MADIRRALKKFAPTFIQAREASLNEADTVLRLCKCFTDVFGYDAIGDISREANLKNKFVDVCLKIDDQIRILVEAKAAPVQLRDRHIEQAQAYASHNNYPWVLLTNGVEWNLYHLTFGEGIEYEIAFSVSLDKEESFDEAVEKLSYLHRHSVKKGLLEKFWETETALSAGSIGKSLFTDSALNFLRRQIRKDSGMLVDTEELASSIQQMFTAEAREQIGPVKIRRKRKTKTKTASASVPNDSNPN
ncbi:MAG: type I restriction enzyme HsdR N-terminal domain-containing protein [Planctomycetes bacterium]|nr:type I restriction enzyme HsdR N-terminal domain-containing protein [Planctomycetota bacterium]